MNLDQAITVVEQALNMAATKGVFNLKDSAVVNTALDLLLEMRTPAPEEEKVAAEE
jgi:hypothetical protein